MRAVVQRVIKASVSVDGANIGEIGAGLVAYVGVGGEDSVDDVTRLAKKIVSLRIFESETPPGFGDVQSTGGEVLAISQFTLFGDVRKGRRPSFSKAAAPDMAREHYESLVGALRNHGVSVQTGQFQADMKVQTVVDGPYTILIDTKKQF